MMKRFMSKVNKLGPKHADLKSRCWVWIGGTRGEGYGGFWLDGKPVKASRVSYALFVGPVPKEKMVLHKCDNRLCVNPDHLFIGTHKDNMEDRNRKNRQASGTRHGSYTKPHTRPYGDKNPARKYPLLHAGERNGRSVLKEQDVKNIRAKVLAGEKRSDLAKQYRVTWRTINCIVKRLLWKHII